MTAPIECAFIVTVTAEDTGDIPKAMEGSSFWFIIAVSMSLTSARRVEYDFKEDVFEVAVDVRTKNVFVGGNNVVYKLDKDLRGLQNTSLDDCARATGNCSNPVRVLEVDQIFRRLLVCGSDHEGQCWFLDLNDLSDKQQIMGRESRIQAGSLQRPIVQQVICESTRGPNVSSWIVASPNTDTASPSASQSKPILSVRQIRRLNGSKFSMNYSFGVDRSVIRKHNSSFYFDFVDGFCQGNECFYLTLQQVNASSNVLTSRLASVCATSLFPYVEIPFEETTRHEQPQQTFYNRALAFSVGKIGRIRPNENESVAEYVVVSVFGRTSERNDRDANPSEGFAVNALRLTEEVQNDRVNLAISICRMGSGIGLAPKSPDWYKGNFSPCNKEDKQVSHTRFYHF